MPTHLKTFRSLAEMPRTATAPLLLLRRTKRSPAKEDREPPRDSRASAVDLTSKHLTRHETAPMGAAEGNGGR